MVGAPAGTGRDRAHRTARAYRTARAHRTSQPILQGVRDDLELRMRHAFQAPVDHSTQSTSTG